MLTGWLIDKTGNYDLPFYIYAGIQVIGGFSMLSISCNRAPAEKSTYIEEPVKTQDNINALIYSSLTEL